MYNHRCSRDVFQVWIIVIGYIVIIGPIAYLTDRLGSSAKVGYLVRAGKLVKSPDITSESNHVTARRDTIKPVPGKIIFSVLIALNVINWEKQVFSVRDITHNLRRDASAAKYHFTTSKQRVCIPPDHHYAKDEKTLQFRNNITKEYETCKRYRKISMQLASLLF